MEPKMNVECRLQFDLDNWNRLKLRLTNKETNSTSKILRFLMFSPKSKVGINGTTPVQIKIRGLCELSFHCFFFRHFFLCLPFFSSPIGTPKTNFRKLNQILFEISDFLIFESFRRLRSLQFPRNVYDRDGLKRIFNFPIICGIS
ncbi:hypothetical protein B9Z55_021207 [Caenorhabditis nigoni]|uniref:Uncharacterized protein n=1 Tax=Caenorhabditis nigoni TaxID=1611254 RepID=A0A2G5TR10_9PELO|nr:hypothetical protein B9Z55_021207 [Caenorhabditis nigoni]